MLSYFQKFNNLPKEIKEAVSSPEVAALIAEISKKYKIDLATTIMKVMAKEVTLDGLNAYLINQFQLDSEQAKNLEKELRQKVFSSVIDYLLGPAAGPKLVFSETDEKEVKANAQPVVTIDFDTAIEKALERVVEKARLGFTDPLASGKFKQVIKTYLRSTRDKKATLDVLIKATELGGVALSRDAAERALSLATTELLALQKTSVQSPPKIPVSEDQPQPQIPQIGPQIPQMRQSPFKKVSAVDYDLESALKSEGRLKKPVDLVKKPITKPTKPIIDPAHKLEPPVPVVVTNKETKPKAPPAPVRQIIKEALDGKPLDKSGLRKVAAVAKGSGPILNLKTSPSGKIRMDDIHFTPQVLSPVDELRYMTIKVFRRLHPDPLKAIEKIKEKLELLGKEDYGKKIQGIVAWNESPLSKLYLSLCRRALTENKSVTEILKTELKQQPDSLKSEELSAIIALNRQLKF